MSHSIAMIGATGAVGGNVLKHLVTMAEVGRISLFGRRTLAGYGAQTSIHQHLVDVLDSNPYGTELQGHDTAICTLGVGQPSKVTRQNFVEIDKNAVVRFASACKTAGVTHFQLLSSVGVHPTSRSFFLRTKGELEDELRALSFSRLSLFHPSMILTPKNRYGLSQAIVLKTWPLLNPFLIGSLKKYRGVKVERLGRAIAKNLVHPATGTEILEWSDIMARS